MIRKKKKIGIAPCVLLALIIPIVLCSSTLYSQESSEGSEKINDDMYPTANHTPTLEEARAQDWFTEKPGEKPGTVDLTCMYNRRYAGKIYRSSITYTYLLLDEKHGELINTSESKGICLDEDPTVQQGQTEQQAQVSAPFWSTSKILGCVSIIALLGIVIKKLIYRKSVMVNK